MDDEADLIANLTSLLAGILEDASAIAASSNAVSDPLTCEMLRQDLGEAVALLAAIEVIQRRRTKLA